MGVGRLVLGVVKGDDRFLVVAGIDMLRSMRVVAGAGGTVVVSGMVNGPYGAYAEAPKSLNPDAQPCP